MKLFAAILLLGACNAVAQNVDPAIRMEISRQVDEARFEAEGTAILAAQQARQQQTPQQPKSAAEVDQDTRISAGISSADWEKSKKSNDPFTNGTFKSAAERQQAPVVPAATVAPTISPLEDPNNAEFKAAVIASQNMAVRIYPDSGVNGTPLAKKMIEIADRMEAQKNPLVYSYDAPFKIAQMAANELGIAPKQ
jgi:hypothetical protein